MTNSFEIGELHSSSGKCFLKFPWFGVICQGSNEARWLLGHRNLQTTQHYSELSDEAGYNYAGLDPFGWSI